ncbi:cysteine desulfurase family protein [Aeoliella sp. SH292]|uniref:cysteine desulfurase family protein n=1 Tax=Aeoliella sp. SH292 TaxID=3454464 RepID=UPI003F948D7D
MQQEPVYLDNNATTPIAPEVVEAMAEAMRARYANPASQHEAGRTARRVIERARERIVELLGGQTGGRTPDRLIFTSGGTEANNLALFGLAAIAERHHPGPHQLVVSPIEHPSVTAATDQLAPRGWKVDRLSVDSSGRILPESLAEVAGENLRIVAAMLGNNETGVLQPIAELAGLAAARGAALHTDAVQAVGKIDVQFGELGATTLSFTAHKFHGPLGIGGLLVKGDTQLSPQLFGGFQQAGLRPGTESVPLVVGMLTALELWHAERQERYQHLASLRDQFELQICADLPYARVVGQGAERLPHTSNIAFVGLDRQALFVALDMAGVACSTGSACASGSSEPSPVLMAMGCEEGVIRGSLRFSFGRFSTPQEVADGARRILLACKNLERAKHLQK